VHSIVKICVPSAPNAKWPKKLLLTPIIKHGVTVTGSVRDGHGVLNILQARTQQIYTYK